VSAVEAILKANTAWAAMGALAVDNRRISEGFVFSRPTLHTGLHIVTIGKDEVNYWNWLKSFSAGLWAAILVTAFGLGFIVYVLEYPYYTKKESNFTGKTGWIDGLWHSCSSITMMSD
jgi:ABC-type amino acid transport substrate-binding protein